METEEAIYVDDSVASFIQVRGLVPLFWDQPGIQTGGMTKIKFSRGYSCTHPAFERHFEWCLLHYGPTLCLNLLGTRDMERMLTAAFQEHFGQLSTVGEADSSIVDVVGVVVVCVVCLLLLLVVVVVVGEVVVVIVVTLVEAVVLI